MPHTLYIINDQVYFQFYFKLLSTIYNGKASTIVDFQVYQQNASYQNTYSYIHILTWNSKVRHITAYMAGIS